MILMPPTTIQRWVDGRWGFKTYTYNWRNFEHVIFEVDQNGTLIEPTPFTLIPAEYCSGGSHDLAFAIYLGIPEVDVRFVT